MALINYKDSQGNWQAIDSLTITDSTLTQPGISADAKAVGDKINDMADYIIDRRISKIEWGSTGYFQDWQKFKSGKVIMNGWGRCSISVSSPWGQNFLGNIPSINYPFTFASVPTVNAFVFSPTGSLWTACSTNTFTSETGTLLAVRSTSGSTMDVDVHIIVIGTWK